MFVTLICDKAVVVVVEKNKHSKLFRKHHCSSFSLAFVVNAAVYMTVASLIT